MSNTLPWITFSYMGKTVSVKETAATGLPYYINTPTTTSTPTPPTMSTKNTASSKTETSLTLTTLSTTHTTSTTSSSSSSASCSQVVTTISDLSAGRALASACPTFIGSIIVPTNVSTPIDLTGMEDLTGSLICNGSAMSGMNSLSGNNLSSIGGGLSIQNANFMTNVSFPELVSIGGLSVVGNAAFNIFDGMPALASIQGPALLNGSFSRISFPKLTTVLGLFDVYSTKALNCAAVAPEYYSSKSIGSGFFLCKGANVTATTGMNGTEISNVGIASSGLALKYKIIIGVSVGVATIVVVVGLLLFYNHRRLLQQQVALVKESRFSMKPRRTPKTPTSTFSHRTPAPNANQGFSVDRATPASGAKAFSPVKSPPAGGPKQSFSVTRASAAVSRGFEIVRKGGQVDGANQSSSPAVTPPPVQPLHPDEPPVWPPPGVWPQGPPPPPKGYVVERVYPSKKKRSIKKSSDKLPELAPPLPLVSLTPPTPLHARPDAAPIAKTGSTPPPAAVVKRGPTPPPGPLGPSGDSVFDAQMELINELDGLNKKDKEKPLTPPEKARRDWIRSQLKDLSRPYRGPVDYKV